MDVSRREGLDAAGMKFILSGGRCCVGKVTRGKGVRSCKAHFSPPRAPPFRARRCCTFRMCEYSDGAMYATVLESGKLSRFLAVKVSWQSGRSLSRTEGGLHSRPVPGTECRKKEFFSVCSINRKQACHAGRFSVPMREK